MESSTNTIDFAAMLEAINTVPKQHSAKVLPTTRSLNEGAVSHWHLTRAKQDFPEEADIDEALRKFIRANKIEDFFFLDHDNDRCKYGPRIYLQHGYWPGFRGPRHYDVDEDHRKFVFDVKKPILRDIDRPKPRTIVLAAAHSSQRGWNLPQTHPRHTLKFPDEILSLIYEFTLRPQDGSYLEPMTTTSNWKTQFRVSSCHRQGMRAHDSDYTSSVKWVDARDGAGTYKLIQPIQRAIIDASFLRTSREIYDLGINCLFASNDWYFSMINLHRRESPPSLIRNGEEYENVHPTVFYPETTDDDYMSTVATTLKEIRDQVPFHEPSGFVYYDRFLRFLHTIGPLNATRIKVLRFGGVCKLHRSCYQDTCGKGCNVDLMDCLRAYIPFIKRFCTGLEKLVLHTKEDTRFKSDLVSYPEPKFKTRGRGYRLVPSERSPPAVNIEGN
ncbi:hypothetical protein DL98DRAFT_587038 [Cadophora sp. DSE1049]|nr:hypothetical protein DL98DRAFT_587038 [Cadophora sp. DSE1049]